ncbi:F-box protein-like protein [Tanacetum coccineum]
MIIKLLKGFLDHVCKIVLVPKETKEERTISITQSLLQAKEDLPNELIHLIQSLLPAKDAARTCVLSKSWQHAWSNIPALRFTTCLFDDHATKEDEIRYINSIDHTLLRYFNDNMSIDCFHLHLDIEKLSLPSHVEKWLQALASRICLKELSLTICGKKVRTKTSMLGWLTIPDEIFSCENLDSISLRVENVGLYQVKMNINPVIKCVFLRVLELVYVHISEESLHNIFSSCSLLEKINIKSHQQLKEFRVKNMRCLRELKIAENANEILEIYGVPNLRVLDYHAIMPRDTFKMDPLGSVRELVLFRVLMDNTFSDMVLSKFPFLESLTLKLINCRLETVGITCVSLKRLTLDLFDKRQFDIQVYAPKLLYFCYIGFKMPSLLFPTKTPEHIKLLLKFKKSNPTDRSFFLKMREALNLASNFDIAIKTKGLVPLKIDLEDLIRRAPFPARNVQQLSFKICLNEHLLKLSPLFDLFFSVCYPRHVNAYYKNGNNYLHELMVIGMMETNTPDLKDIEIKNPRNGKWENMTDSWRSFHFHFELPWRSFHDEANAYNSDEFKLNWCS